MQTTTTTTQQKTLDQILQEDSKSKYNFIDRVEQVDDGNRVLVNHIDGERLTGERMENYINMRECESKEYKKNFKMIQHRLIDDRLFETRVNYGNYLTANNEVIAGVIDYIERDTGDLNRLCLYTPIKLTKLQNTLLLKDRHAEILKNFFSLTVTDHDFYRRRKGFFKVNGIQFLCLEPVGKE